MRGGVVFGVGNPNADLMFVGENIATNTARPVEVLTQAGDPAVGMNFLEGSLAGFGDEQAE